MPTNGCIMKNSLRVLVIVVLFSACIAIVSANPGTSFSPAAGFVSPGTTITITTYPAANASFGMDIVMDGNAATTYPVSSFTLPFSLKSATVYPHGITNVADLSIIMTRNPGSPYTCYNDYACTGNLASGVYSIGGTISPTDSTHSTDVSLHVNGTVGEAHPGGAITTLDTTGATYGSTLTITVNSQSATYTFPTPTQAPPVTQTSTTSITATGTVDSVPVTTGISGMTTAQANFSVDINTSPSSGASITSAITPTLDTTTLTKFESAYALQGSTINDVAYVMTVTKTGITTTGPATITMTVPMSWVTAHGGINAINIIREADDGTVSTLATTYTGLDSSGNAVFTALSPNGLCVFAAVSIQSLPGSSDGDDSAAAAAQVAPQNNGGTATTSVTGTGTISSGTVSAGTSGLTGATGSWTSSLSTQPSSGASITTTISQNPPAATLAAFQSVYQVQGSTINAVAFTMTVTKNGVTTTGPATITTTVPKSWVESHGGVNAMSIARQGDDGLTETLATTFTGYDPVTGNAIFTATSPHGLSIFAVVAIQSSAASGNTTVIATTPANTSTEPVVQAPTTAPGSISTTGQPTKAPTTGATKTPLSPLVSIGALSLVLIITANIKNRK